MVLLVILLIDLKLTLCDVKHPDVSAAITLQRIKAQ